MSCLPKHKEVAMYLVLQVNRKMATHFKIITCEHIASEFCEKFLDMIVQENFNFECTCDTYGLHGLFISISDSCMEILSIYSNNDKHYCVRCVLNILNYKLEKFCFLYKNSSRTFRQIDVTSLRSYLSNLKSDFQLHVSAFYNKILARSVQG